MTTTVLSWPVLVPEALVGLSALAAWVLPWSTRREEPRRGVERRLELPAVFGAVLLVAWIVELIAGAQVGQTFHGGFVQDRFALYAKSFVLLAALLAVMLGDWEIADEPERELSLVLWACFGALVAASAGDLVVLWSGWLLAAVAALAAFAGLAATRPAGLSIRLLAAAAGGLFLTAVAFALVYATAGVSDLAGIAAKLPAGATSGELTVAAVVGIVGAGTGLIAAAMLLRGAAAWPASASVAAGSVAGLAAGAAGIVLLRFLAALVGSAAGWSAFLAVVAAALLVFGAAGALGTRSLRGLVGWLALGQTGWIAAGLAAHQRLAMAGSLYLLGIFLVVICGVSALLGEEILDRLPALAGRATRGVVAASGMAVALLSLGGAPPAGGWFGEFAIMSALASSGYLWLVLIGLGGTALSVVAVARVLWMIFLAEPAAEAAIPINPVRIAGTAALVIAIVGFGVFAFPLHGLAVQGAEALGLP